MTREPDRNLTRVGTVVAVAFVAMALAILGITSRQGLFERKASYYSTFPDASGLKDGAGVWFQGVEVGYVEDLAFDEESDAAQVIVRYRIRAALVPRMRSGLRAYIRSLGLLGDKYIALEVPPGKAPGSVNILPGGKIPADTTVNFDALGRDAQDLMGNLVVISRSMDDLVRSVSEGGGVVTRLLKDPKMGHETLDHLNNISKSLDQISDSVARGRGLGGKLLTDREYGEKTSADLASALHNANALLSRLQEGRGGAGKFLVEGGDGEELVADLALAAKGLAAAADGLQKPGTLANRLFVDEAYGEHLAGNLLSISDSLDSILKKIDRGEGTVGGLVNDRSVYDALSATVEGMKKSGLVRWYLEKKAKEAAAAAQKAEEKKVPHP